jgi:hypothetical protein
MVRPRPCSIAAVFLLSACDRGVGPTVRPLEVRGLPACPPKTSYTRPIVVRVDRERALFDEAFTTQSRIDAPAAFASITVPRARMRITIRAGLCTPTSLATWDCAAATWLSTTTADLDGRASAASITLPAFEAPCSR